jgi:hypothetical protein
MLCDGLHDMVEIEHSRHEITQTYSIFYSLPKLPLRALRALLVSRNF